MHLKWLWLHWLITTVVFGAPRISRLSSEEQELPRWDDGQTGSGQQRHPAEVESGEEINWFDPFQDLKLRDDFKPFQSHRSVGQPNQEEEEEEELVQKRSSNNAKRSDLDFLNWFSRSRPTRLNAFKRQMARKNQKKSDKLKEQASEDPGKGLVVCKEIPYSICFRIDQDGKMIPLPHNEEPRPVRILRVY